MVRGDARRTSIGGVIDVRHGKGNKPRAVVIPPDLMSVIEDWEKDLAGQILVLFPSLQGPKKGNPISGRYMRQVLADLSRKAGVFKITPDGSRAPINPHVLRHSYATSLLSSGLSLRELQHQLGHSSILTTEIYTHIQNDQLAERIRLALDENQHVDPMIAESNRSALERRITDALGDAPGRSPQERVVLGLIAKDIATMGLQEALECLAGQLANVD